MNLRKPLSMAKQKALLVTGAAGFIGYHLVKLLLAKGETVVGFDNLNDYYDVNLKIARLTDLNISATNFTNFKIFPATNASFYFFKGGLEDEKTWQTISENFEIKSVIHLAAQAGVRYSLEQPRKYISSNVLGFLNVLEFCRENSLQKLIYASSSSVYGMESAQPFSESESCDKPVSLYAATKRSNELMAQTYFHLYGIESVGLRFFTVYGPWGRPDMAPFLFTKAALENEPIKVFNNGNQQRDFTFVDDIVAGVCQVFDQPEHIIGATVCNIGNGSPVALMDFISTIEIAAGATLQKNYLPAQPGDVEVTFADTTQLQSRFGYQPKTDLNQGIKSFVDWYKTYYLV